MRDTRKKGGRGELGRGGLTQATTTNGKGKVVGGLWGGRQGGGGVRGLGGSAERHGVEEGVACGYCEGELEPLGARGVCHGRKKHIQKEFGEGVGGYYRKKDEKKYT